jgi:hypothetical protein
LKGFEEQEVSAFVGEFVIIRIALRCLASSQGKLDLGIEL